MVSYEYNGFKIDKGADFTFTGIRKDNSGNVIDITGYSYFFRVYDADKNKLVHEASNTNGEITIPVGTDGKFIVKIPYTETEKFSFENGKYELVEQDSSGSVQRLLHGKIELIK